MSPRHFGREFRLNTGQSPARAVEQLRVETARILIDADRLTVERIASLTGFTDPNACGGHSCESSANHPRR